VILRKSVLGAALFLAACGGDGGSSGGGNGGGGTPPPPPSITVTVNPTTASIQVGATEQFTCAVANSNNQQCNWTATAGTISATGLYTAPATPGAYTVTATAAADTTKTASAAVAVTAPPSQVQVTITPATVNLDSDRTQLFTCTVTGSTNTACTLSVREGAAGGTISDTGHYTPPTPTENGGTYHVVATSVADPSRTAVATVNVGPRPSLSVTSNGVPLTGWIYLRPSQTRQLGCVVRGVAGATCNLSVAPGNGTLSTSGLYTAPSVPGRYSVIATASHDPNFQAVATIVVEDGLPPAWVTGYYAGWYWQYASPADVDMSAMTHFVFGRVAPGCGTIPPESGPCVPGAVVEAAGNAHQSNIPGSPDGRPVEDYLIDRAHQAGTKALLMVGGMGDGMGFLVSTSDAVRPQFVKNLVDYAEAHNYDGLDIDWEDELSPDNDSYRRLIALITDLRAEAATRSRYQNPDNPFLVTFPGYGKNLNIDAVQDYEVTVANMVDQYNMMNYGIGSVWFGGGWTSWFSSPIFGENGTHNTSLSSSVNAYVARGVARNKLGVGIGFYGIYYKAPITGPDMPTNNWDDIQMDDNALSYRNLVEKGYLSNGVRMWDERARSSYRTYGAAGYVPANDPGSSPAGYLSYETSTSLEEKAKWVRGSGVGGVILWTIDYGYLPGNGPDGSGGTNPLLANVKCWFLDRDCANTPTIP
jgi:chitinase